MATLREAGYSRTVRPDELKACPFCAERFDAWEHDRCPHCDLKLADPKWLELPHDPEDMQPLPWWHYSQGRGALLAVALAGLGTFFAPWVIERAPEQEILSGPELARRLYWIWAPAVAWFVMIPLVVSRRSLHSMRGARVAVGLLGAIAALTAVLRGSRQPASSILRPVELEWGWGLYATGALGLCAVFLAAFFGGRAGTGKASASASPSI